MKTPLTGCRTVPPLLSILVVGVPSAALAAEPAEVEALIEQANEYRRQGLDGKALTLMQKAYNLASTARTAAQLGLVEISLGYWLQAERHLTEALASDRDPWIQRNRGILERSLAGARASIGQVEITGHPHGAAVFVNGSLVGTLPLGTPVRVGDGPVKIEVRARDHEPELRTLNMTRGTKLRVAFGLRPVLNPPASLSSVASRSPGNPSANGGLRRAAPWLMGGAAVAGVAFGIAETAMWARKKDQFNNHVRALPDNTTTSMQGVRDCGARLENRGGDECARLYGDAQRARTWALVGYVGGLAFGAATVGLLMFSDRPSSSVAVTCGPVAPSIGGTCRVRF